MISLNTLKRKFERICYQDKYKHAYYYYYWFKSLKTNFKYLCIHMFMLKKKLNYNS